MEKNIAKFQAEKSVIESKMADPDLYDGDSAKLVDLQKDLGWVAGQIAETEEVWLGLQQELEEASAAAGWARYDESKLGGRIPVRVKLTQGEESW